MKLKKIISGGQTGADQGGLEAGRELGIETGGTAPLGWKTEKGPMERLLKRFGLVEAGVEGYSFRTRMNILNSDGTAIFGSTDSPGSKLTLKLCKELGKQCLLFPCLEDLPEFLDTLPEWLEKHKINVLNVAGNRESRNPGIQKTVKDFLVVSLKERVE